MESAANQTIRADQNGRHLRLLSINLWEGRASSEALAQQLEALDVDVLAVQELSDRHAGVISELLPHGKLEPTTDSRGLGIALRHPGNVQRLALRERDARVVELLPGEWPGLPERIELVNVHIHAPHVFPQWRSLACRRDQIRTLNEYLRGVYKPHRVVLGDFNATPIWPAYRALAAHLSDAAKLHAASNGGRPASTWGPGDRAPRLLRIDHAFLHGVSVAHFEVVDVSGSDHSGILVDLKIQP
jgi:endonuclease/exonuclease/phosphatase family metal-dependent hydrolase